MKFLAARAALLLALPLAVACDDGTGPAGQPSDFVVQVYVELDDSLGMDPSEPPVPSTVTVASNFSDLVLVQPTDEAGTVTFADLPPGSYTVTHVATDQPAGTTLRGNASQTVVAPQAGAVVTTLFVYDLLPGSLAGVAFRDDDGSGSFEAGQDSTFEGVGVLVFAGADANTTGTPLVADTTAEDGTFDVGELTNGDYTVLVEPLNGTAVVGDNPRNVTIEPGAATHLELELEGDPTGPVVSIQAARDTAEGETVKVRGVVTAGQGVYRDDSFYVQDAGAAIFVFGADAGLALEPGDSVQVIGERASTRGEALLIASSVILLGAGEIPEPQTVTTSDVNAGVLPGQLAQLAATVDSIGADTGTGYNVYVRDAVDEAIVFVDADSGIEPDAFTVDALHTIIGILAVYDADDDGTLEEGEYHLKPRTTEDVAAME